MWQQFHDLDQESSRISLRNRCAIHVSFNANQWWYQPQALLTERSGLIESPSVWFLHRALRTHGYDQTTLEPLWGKPLNTTSWEVGDVVIPLQEISQSDPSDARTLMEARDCFGRIVTEAKDKSSSTRPRGRTSGTVLVEFTDPAFGRAVGVFNALEDASDNGVEVRRVSIEKLRHGKGGGGQFGVFKSDFDAINKAMTDAELNAELSFLPDSEMEQSDSVGIGAEPANVSTPVVVSSRLRAEIEGVSCLDPASIQSVAKMCEKQPSVCSNAFASGLCDAILAGVTLAEENTKTGKVNDRMGVAVSSLGLLSSILCRSLLSADEELLPNAGDDDDEMDQDEDLNLSAVFAEASLPLYDGSAAHSETSSANTSRRDLMETLSARRMAARARGPLFRARARHTNSTSPRSTRDEWNADGDEHADTRVAITNGLLRNSLTWLEACLHLPQDKSNAKAGSESLLSKMTNARDEHGMSLLLLAITFGCSKEIVRRLILSEANVSKTEITAAASTNQPDLLAVLLEHAVCPKQVTESLHVSPEVAAVFKAAESRQKIQEQALRHKAETFVSTLIVSLCRLESACRSRTVRIQRLGRSSSEALVGNVLLRALHENQHKALVAASPRRRKHGGPAQLLADSDSERLSLSLGAPFGTSDSEVFASASAMSPQHGVLLGLPKGFFSSRFHEGSSKDRQELLSALLSLAETLMWSNEEDSIAAGLTILYAMLEGAPLGDLSCEIERYGLRDLMSAYELIAGRRIAEIKNRLNSTKPSNADTDAVAEASRANKKRPRPHFATSTPCADDGVVLCPKSHVAELHLTKHSSFRCDLCGKNVLRDRPMHGCRECDWDACESCTNQVEGGIVKWGHILELAMSCRKLLDGPAEEKASADISEMKVDETFEDSKVSALPDFGTLARRLRGRDYDAAEELASLMESSDRMTNHEFVSFILPALHSALVGTQRGNMNDQFFFKTLYAFTDVIESSAAAQPPREGDDESQMSVDEEPNEGSVAGNRFNMYGQVPMNLANRVPSVALRRIQSILSFSENTSVLHVLWDKKRSGSPVTANGSKLKSLTKPIELKFSPWRPSNVPSLPVGANNTTVFVEPLLPSTELERHVLRAGTIENESYLSFCRR